MGRAQQYYQLAQKRLAPMVAAGPGRCDGPSLSEFTAVRHFMMVDLGLLGLPLLVDTHTFGFRRRTAGACSGRSSPW